MSPNRNMRSIFAQCRNFSQSRRNLSSSGNRKVSKVARFVVQGTGATLGLILGYYYYRGEVAKYEELRQQMVMDVFKMDRRQVEDLREKLWPELRNIRLFRNMEKIWSESDLKKNMKSVQSEVEKNIQGMLAKMLPDAREKMLSDRKSE